jgi:hypothetical protein
VRVWLMPLVEARAEADLGGRWRIRARAAASVGEFLRWCTLGKAELWSHGVNDARSGPAPNWRSRCWAEVYFNDANCLVRPRHLLSRPPSWPQTVRGNAWTSTWSPHSGWCFCPALTSLSLYCISGLCCVAAAAWSLPVCQAWICSMWPLTAHIMLISMQNMSDCCLPKQGRNPKCFTYCCAIKLVTPLESISLLMY